MKRTLLAVAAITAATVCSSHAAVVWTGAADTDIFNDANWDFSGSGVSTISSNTSIADDVLIANGNVTIPNQAGQVRFQIGDGFSLTVDNSTLAPVGGGNDGVGGMPGSTGVTVNVINGSNFNPFFVVNQVQVNIDASSSATFGGGGNPINLSTIDLSPGGTLAFLLEDPTEFTNEHLSKLTVNGQPAVDGVNIQIAAAGSGSVITVIPEPATATLAGLAGLGLLLRRRR